MMLRLRFFFQQEALRQASIADPDMAQQEDADPPGRQTENKQQQIGHPGTDTATKVVQLAHDIRVRPARIDRRVSQENKD